MLLRFNIFSPHADLIHGITTVRFEGVEPFNLSDDVGPERSRAIECRRRLCQALELPFEKLTVARQVHKGSVRIVDERLAGCGAEGNADAIHPCDALVTNLHNVPLMTLSADCPLILIYAPRPKALAVLHASWRAMVDRIVANAVTSLAETFHCRPGNMRAGIGPSAGPCCYQVGEDFCQTIVEETALGHCIIRDGTRCRFDLWRAARTLLTATGLKDRHIETLGRCTCCDRRFFSYRREGPQTGRFALIAALK